MDNFQKLKEIINEDVFQKLIEGDVNTLSAILLSSTWELQQSTNLSKEELEEVKKRASQIILQNNFSTADKVPPWERLKTGCHSIDIILRGGIPINGITEIYGCSGTGKTQLCLQLALMVQLPPHIGGKNKGAVYICTEDVFPTKRFHQLSEVFKVKYDLDFESRVFLEHTADFKQLRRCLQVQLPQLLCHNPIGLIVIDSIAGVFRSENDDVCYTARGHDIGVIASTLHEVCDKHKIGVVCLNQVTENLSAGETVPCLGLAWSNYVTCRFSISRYENSTLREFEIVFSPDLPNKKCNFIITAEGVTTTD